MTLIPRPTSLSFGSLDLEAWASPLRCARLSSAQKPYYPGRGPSAAPTSAPSPAETSARSPLSPGASGDPHQVSCVSLPRSADLPGPAPARLPRRPGLSDRRPTPGPPTPAAVETGRERPSPLGAAGSREGTVPGPRPCSPLPRTTALTLRSVPSRAPFDAAPNSLLVGDAERTQLFPAPRSRSLSSKLSQDALTCSSLDPQALRSTSEGPGLFP